jgi:hypothetical protein
MHVQPVVEPLVLVLVCNQIQEIVFTQVPKIDNFCILLLCCVFIVQRRILVLEHALVIKVAKLRLLFIFMVVHGFY